MLEQMYYSDFCGCNHSQVNSILGNVEYISREDRKFLDISDSGTKKDGAHYEVPHSGFPSLCKGGVGGWIFELKEVGKKSRGRRKRGGKRSF